MGKATLEKLKKYRYPALICALGVILMLLPTGGKTRPDGVASLETILSQTEGVGEVSVLISESGVVVVCRGADRAEVRLDIYHAVESHTGFSSDKVTILKMA